MKFSFLVPGMPFDGLTIGEASLGGSETAGYYVARALVARGHDVTVFSNGARPGKYEGVEYAQQRDWHGYANNIQHDVAVVQRTPEVFVTSLAARLNVLWCHDLALARAAGPFRAAMWNIDVVAVVSEFMRQQYREVYDLPERFLFRTRNGLDLALLDKVMAEGLPRDRRTLVFAARPERGLDVLLGKVMPLLLRVEPRVKLKIAGYANNPPQLQSFYEQCDKMALALPLGAVENVGCLKKEDYYRVLATAGAYVYPTPSPMLKQFAEVSCMSAMEAQGCGLPVVTSRRGALPETLDPEAGVLVEGDPMTDGYAEVFAASVLNLIRDDDAWSRASAAGRARARELDWSGVAEQWEREFGRRLRELRGPDRALVYHLVRHSNVDGLRALASTETPLAGEIEEYVAGAYKFLETEETFREHYARHGADTIKALHTTPEDQLREKFETTTEDRFNVLEFVIKSYPDATRVLDYGCGHGWSTIYLHNRVGREWLGVDVDLGAVEWSRECAAKFARDPAAVSFEAGGHEVLADRKAVFDLAIVSEVLEHARDPYAVIEAVERAVKLGGVVVVTMPQGPVEFASPNWYNFRNHVREWGAVELEEVFAKKKYTLGYTSQGHHGITGEPQGFHTITYVADHEPVCRVDLRAHLRRQRPRQSLSVAIIAGGSRADEHLHSCLRALPLVADQIVVADCGMSQESKRIAAQYPTQVVPGLDPKVHGFDVARNEVLKYATGDWILWIDTDETLVNQGQMSKYLRENMYAGYSVRQHHFAVDVPYPPDLPVRLFRRVHHDGVRPRFFGSIHEHPERALNEGPGPVIVLSDVSIGHPGYYHETIRRERFQRNVPLLELDTRRNPKRLLQQHFLARDNVIRANHTLQANGGVMTPEIRGWLEDTVAIFRRHFLGQTTYTGIDTITYYSQALRLLNEGFEVAFDIAMEKDGVKFGTGTPKQYRFASVGDLKTELGREVAVAETFTKQWW
jgi:glycosyltransferase involved in cell wall biosynthesis/2-polyprenyl-3-methyl-5-hydroxy-6-metoxy-1,4-benzoquinol methylase